MRALGRSIFAFVGLAVLSACQPTGDGRLPADVGRSNATTPAYTHAVASGARIAEVAAVVEFQNLCLETGGRVGESLAAARSRGYSVPVAPNGRYNPQLNTELQLVDAGHQSGLTLCLLFINPISDYSQSGYFNRLARLPGVAPRARGILSAGGRGTIMFSQSTSIPGLEQGARDSGIYAITYISSQ